MSTKGPKNNFTVVPWRNSEEFIRVYNDVFSDSIARKRMAVNDICVWDTRCHPSLPTAIEATLGIIRAISHDMLYQADKSFCQEGDIQMLYSMALVRFVNLTLEHHQNSVTKVRMSVLAAKHNIPFWLIDLRNAAVHEYCPSLSVLRLGADEAMEYLKETFWSKEASNIKPKTILPSTRETKFMDVLNQYKSIRFQKMESLTPCRSKGLNAVLKKMDFFILHEKEKFIDLLVQPGNFIAADDIKRLVPKNGPFLVEEFNLGLPDKIHKFWFPLVRKIHSNELMPMFLEKLLLAQEKCSNKICQKTAVAWVQQILIGAASKSTHLAECFIKRGMLLNFPCLIYSCMRGATPYSCELLGTILSKIRNREKYENLFSLLTLYQGRLIPEEPSSLKRKRDPDQEIVFSVEDVEEELNKNRSKKMRFENDVNIWSSPSVTMNFSGMPIGCVLNPVIPDNNKDNQSLEDSWKELIKLGPSADDDFIIVNKIDDEGTVEEENTHDINTFPSTTRPENFDMVYKRRPKQ